MDMKAGVERVLKHTDLVFTLHINPRRFLTMEKELEGVA